MPASRRPAGGRPLLATRRIGLAFGGVRALHDVSFEVLRGEIVSIIGPNGAGKTSLLNVISGVYRPNSGEIEFDGQTRRHLPPESIAGLGIARTFQNVVLFKDMSVLDNVLVGRHAHMRAGVMSCGLWWGRGEREERANRQLAEQILDVLELGHLKNVAADTLSYGLQKRVELGRALALQPSLLLLDEPMAGMNAEEKAEILRFVLEAAERLRATVVLIEHDMGVVMDVSDWVVVLDHGIKIAEGTPADVSADQAVIRAYLGEDE